MNRLVEPELLDQLPPEDPRAIRSRRDLQRLNAWMRNTQIMTRELRACFNGNAPRKLVELGAGDATFLLGIAKKLPSCWQGTEAILVDRKGIVSSTTIRGFEKIGWKVKTVSADVFDWLKEHEPCDVMMANLFLHHFSDAELTTLFLEASTHAKVFIGIEPRRWGWALFFGRFVWMIGCNGVTQHDAIASIRAGFAREEISALWPRNGTWVVQERPGNFASHLFVARRAK